MCPMLLAKLSQMSYSESYFGYYHLVRYNKNAIRQRGHEASVWKPRLRRLNDQDETVAAEDEEESRD